MEILRNNPELEIRAEKISDTLRKKFNLPIDKKGRLSKLLYPKNIKNHYRPGKWPILESTHRNSLDGKKRKKPRENHLNKTGKIELVKKTRNGYAFEELAFIIFNTYLGPDFFTVKTSDHDDGMKKNRFSNIQDFRK